MNTETTLFWAEFFGPHTYMYMHARSSNKASLNEKAAIYFGVMCALLITSNHKLSPMHAVYQYHTALLCAWTISGNIARRNAWRKSNIVWARVVPAWLWDFALIYSNVVMLLIIEILISVARHCVGQCTQAHNISSFPHMCIPATVSRCLR